ncbi:MAG: YcgN family cysteine cluster protein, partial [Pseudomonadota bacterium]
MSEAEWEALCDGCGRCCLVKLEDMDDGRIFYTDVACRLLDRESCRCGDYANRKDQVPDCVKLTVDELSWLDWMPPTCAY